MRALLRGAALGFVLGTAWGVLARVWMRLISTDPEFSWVGTLSIVVLSAVLGAGVGVVDAARRAGRSSWWTLAVVPGLLLFMSPGMVLAPSLLLGGLARGARGRVLQVVGALGIAASLGLAIWLEGDDVDVVYVVGFTALAVSLAWAGSLVVQRRQRSASPHEPARAARSAPMVVSPP